MREGLLLLILLSLSLTACGRFGEPDNPPPTAPPATSTPVTSSSNNTGGAVASPTSFADVVARVAPAVVTIHSARRARAPRQHPFFDDPRFREFFGLPRGPQQDAPAVRGLGSGVIVSNEGYVLTNHHVIDGAEEITVELNDHRTYTARLIGSDPPSDLAVLKVDESNLPVLTMGNSDQARVGDMVLAIGNPLGLDQTVTAGIISAKGRSTGLSDGSFEDFLQTDAPINRGNSGGALVSATGELIGINSQILSPTGGNIGIGFAIPVNMARNVMDQLIRGGAVRRGSLGVTIQGVTPEAVSQLGLPSARGALVASVVPGGAAERAGVRAGDVIIGFNGNPVNDPNALRNAVAASQPGSQVELTVWRNGGEQRLPVTLGELNTQARQPRGE
ncbi:MAG TPA: Do family serine endopeptidase [Pyrinomonadaceae bacterium]|nr:Do family serine endopeptidase [Pyrinomonadaceae bacterium]